MSIIRNIKLDRINTVIFPNIISRYPDIQEAVINYSDDYFNAINKLLRKIPFSIQFNENEILELKKHIRSMDKAIEIYNTLIKQYDVDRDIVVVRKVNLWDSLLLQEQIKKIKSGIYIDPGFMSTSTTDSYHTISGTTIRFEIELTSLNYGAFIGGLAKYKTENEFLIKRGTPFKVKEHTEINGIHHVKLKSL